MKKVVQFLSKLYDSLTETQEAKYHREMTNYLSQASDRLHLEHLERQWEKEHGRLY
jgi:hypothetical protein